MANFNIIRPAIEPSSFRQIKQKNCGKDIHNKLFTFTIYIQEPGKFNWAITRTFQEFIDLHDNLQLGLKKGEISSLPVLPGDAEFLSSQGDSQIKVLSEYLQFLSSQIDVCLFPGFLEFIEVSVLSFSDTEKKRKEGYVNKRTGGRVVNDNKCCNCMKYCKRLQKRWMIIKDNMVGYLTNHMKGRLNEVLIFKGKFEVLKGLRDTGYSDGILIITQKRKFCFRAGSEFKMEEWFKDIREAKEQSEWSIEENRFSSSFPNRHFNRVYWFVDGLNYFNEVFSALQKAKREVFISDWWLSPDLFLMRPSTKYPNSQVSEVLGLLADRGVSIYVHLYKEVSFALTLNSLYTQEALLKRNKNIKVIRHPHRSVTGGEFLWSHHEKIICIDQEIAFIGGIDLCYGRMDTSEHRLTDEVPPFFWNGIDYSNVRISDFQDVENFKTDSLNRSTQPRMPWHDIGIKAVGKVASDISLHFIELWNHVMTDITSNYHRDKYILHPVASQVVVPKEDEESSYIKTSHFFPSKLKSSSISSWNSSKYCPVERVSSETSLRINLLDLYIKNDEDSKRLHEDRAVLVEEASDRIKREHKHSSLIEFDESLHESRNSLACRRSATQPKIWQKRIKKEKIEIEEENKIKLALQADFEEGDEAWARNLLIPELKGIENDGKCDCQVVRSASTWSLGVEKTENSIYDAYLHLIDEATSYIYIENQFFVSSTAGSIVKNNIAEALVRRIKIAAENQENFKVFVVLPLLPGFTGAIDDHSASVLRVQLHWLYETVVRGNKSIIQQLLGDPNIKDPFDYIKFFGLRNHGVLNNTPVTEIVYVHSKLMIVDDRTVIVGSANINDRSLLGNHDSEIAMVIKDNEKVKSVLGGTSQGVSKFAFSLRVQIFKEILGVSDENILQDPLSENFNDYLTKTAEKNTFIYNKVFKCVPDNDVKTFKQLDEFESSAELHEYHKYKNDIRGFIVNFPLAFLCLEDLRMKIFNKEYYIPDESFI